MANDDPPDFEASCVLMRDLGFVIQDAQSPPRAFGSWFICAVAQGKSLRVVWDGRDNALIIQEPSLRDPGDWSDRWIACLGYKHKPGELKNGLLSVLKK